MTHTQILLPKAKKSSTYKLVLSALILIAVITVSGALISVYIQISTGNRAMEQTLNKLSANNKAKAVSAPISTPTNASGEANLVPVNPQEAQALLDKVNELAILPQDEAPTLATVTDKESLSKDVFFRESQIDDKLFLYQKTGIVLLYRPSAGKIVNMGMVLNSAQKSEVTTTPSQPLF